MRYESILIVLTEECHVGCQHCGYIGSRRNRDISPDLLREWIRQIGSYGFPEIIFTGGEAFERYDLLSAGAEEAADLGLKTSVFTSSFWAENRERAYELLQGLPGLVRVYLSTDVYHQKRVPFHYVRNAIDAAIALDIPKINLNITYATDFDRAYIASQYKDYGSRVDIYADRVIPNPNFSPRVLAGQDAMVDLSHSYGSRCWLGTPLLDPAGDLFTCHVGKMAAHKNLSKSPYYLGNLRKEKLFDIMSRSQVRHDYQFLRTHGPDGVAAVARQTPELLKILPARTFTNACDMCRSTLSEDLGRESLAAHAQKHEQDIDARLILALKEDAAFTAAI